MVQGSASWRSGSARGTDRSRVRLLLLEPRTVNQNPEPGTQQLRTVNRQESVCERPRFAVWGGRLDLRKQVEPLGSRALGFLAPRHAHHAALRFS